jgi:preprotein translocase subunit SecD
LVLYIFIIQSIPFVTLNLSGVVASVIAFAVAVLSNAYVFEKIREEYAIGKKIHLSCKGGFKKALWGIVDSHAIMLLAGAFLWIFAPATLKVFGICIVVGSFLSAFSSLAMTRYFVNIYLPINSTKAKKLHLYRDKSVKEIKEEVEIIPEDVASTLTMGGENE